jgi:urease accessory protein
MIAGRLELVFAARGGRTVLVHSHASAPIKIVRPFWLEDGRALVQILTLGPGLCGGDGTAIDITVEAGARAVVIAQSATRILGMAEDLHASQTVALRVRAGGQLEYFPGLTIPFPDTRFVQQITVEADSDARVGVVESWAMGRLRCGEYLRFRRLRSETRVAVDRVPVYTDVIDLEPAAVNVAATGILDGRHYLASGFWYGSTVVPGPASTINGPVLMAFGHASPHQVYLRALADDGFELGEALRRAVEIIHTGWHQRPIPVRRFTA